jgi:methionyl-tRNA formyltransferase
LTKKLNLVFAGTPEFSANVLEKLQKIFNVVAIFCQSDKPKGRGQKLTQCAVKEFALNHDIKIIQPEKLNTPENLAILKELNCDVMVVVAYGQLLTPEFLEVPKYGCLNIHTSLLPRWRGAAPIQRAIFAGDSKTGVSIMQMDKGLDTGAIINQAECVITDTDSAEMLYNKLQKISCDLIIDTLQKIDKITPIMQKEEGVTYAKKLSKDEAWIDWRQSAQQINQQIRAFNPYPIAQSSANSNRFEAQTIRIFEAVVLNEQVSGEIGHVRSHKNIDVITGNGVLRILKLQLAGKKVVEAKDFINAYQLQNFIVSPL